MTVNEGSTGRTVGQVAELVGVSVRALHHYDAIGLVRPAARSSAGYRTYLDADIERLHQMVAAVEKMMEARTMGIHLSPDEQSEIFGDNWLGEQYAAEAEQRWGETDAHKQSVARTASFGKDDWQRVKNETDALEAAFADALREGVPADSERARQLAERHRASIGQFYDCGHEMHRKLAETYVSDERFRQHYEDVAPGLAQYTRDVVVANADTVAAHGA